MLDSFLEGDLGEGIAAPFFRAIFRVYFQGLVSPLFSGTNSTATFHRISSPNFNGRIGC